MQQPPKELWDPGPSWGGAVRPQSPGSRLLFIVLYRKVESQAKVGAMEERWWIDLEVGEARRDRGIGNCLTTPNHADVSKVKKFHLTLLGEFLIPIKWTGSS